MRRRAAQDPYLALQNQTERFPCLRHVETRGLYRALPALADPA